MMMRIPLTFLCLFSVMNYSLGDEKSPPAVDQKAVQGQWTAPFSRAPGSQDALIQRKLEIGLKGKPDAVRLSWSMYCGISRITGGEDYVGRLIEVEKKEKTQRLIFSGEKGARYEVEFTLSGNELNLKGSIKGVDVSDGWTRKPVTTK